MRKSEIVKIGKHISKESFKICIQSISGDFGLLKNEVVILGFKEDEFHCRMTFMLEGLQDYRVEVLYDKESNWMKSNIFKIYETAYYV